ncbi:MAG TPA: FtsL-like putative cell division protein [Chitinophagaceae bacterium]|nr:FtsL-like putative cell division protein [Chitinophagaceae bacterium]HNL82772.1 FtsL-like putative cell division protein [Chitinophagaceae bacterium]
MAENENIKNTNQPNEKKGLKKGVGVLFNSQWITNNLYFFLFLGLLAIIYIANGHWADKTVRNIDKAKKELRDLQFEYKTIKAELMHKSEEAQVLKAAEPLGLKISKEVPVRLPNDNEPIELKNKK